MLKVKRFTVNIQLSLYTTENKQQVLITDFDDEVLWQGDADQSILDLMGEHYKGHFYAHMTPSNKVCIDSLLHWN